LGTAVLGVVADDALVVGQEGARHELAKALLVELHPVLALLLVDLVLEFVVPAIGIACIALMVERERHARLADLGNRLAALVLAVHIVDAAVAVAAERPGAHVDMTIALLRDAGDVAGGKVTHTVATL